MTYPASIHESQVLVETSRPKRIHESFPHFLPEERESLLRAFHPDYIADAFRELRIGPNKGDRTPRELADVLEGMPLVIGDTILSSRPRSER